MSPSLQQALDLVKGFEDCRLQAYTDQRGRWTVGWGSTGPGIGAGVTWTQKEADDALQAGVQLAYNCVSAALKEPQTDEQIAALTSLTYNIGRGDFLKSGVLRGLNLGDAEAAGRVFLLWCHVGSYFNFGLYRRRCEELFYGWPDVAKKIGVAA